MSLTLLLVAYIGIKHRFAPAENADIAGARPLEGCAVLSIKFCLQNGDSGSTPLSRTLASIAALPFINLLLDEPDSPL